MFSPSLMQTLISSRVFFLYALTNAGGVCIILVKAFNKITEFRRFNA